MTYAFWTSALARARTEWQDDGDHVAAAIHTLTAADTTLLGSTVAQAAQAFVDDWTTELASMRDAAQEYADALGATLRLGVLANQETVTRMRSLLPWEARDAQPGQDAVM